VVVRPAKKKRNFNFFIADFIFSSRTFKLIFLCRFCYTLWLKNWLSTIRRAQLNLFLFGSGDKGLKRGHFWFTKN